MKKLFTLLFILAFFSATSVVNAQLVMHYNNNHLVSSDNGALLEAEAYIVNTSASEVIYKVRRTNVTLAPGHDSYFCLEVNCYTPATYLSPADTIAPGDSIVLITYASPGGTNGTDIVNYKAFEVTDSVNNKAIVEFTYDFATGIKTLNNSAYNYMNCVQSSTEDVTNVNYSIVSLKNAKLVIRNLLGSVVRVIDLSDKQGALRISTAELPSGIYMYFLINNDEPVATKKMVISHR